MDELTGFDYLTRPVVEICDHPDYSSQAMEIIHKVVQMTTSQLEELNLKGEIINDGRQVDS